MILFLLPALCSAPVAAAAYAPTGQNEILSAGNFNTYALKPAKLTIIKQVSGVGPAYDWSFDFDGELGPFTLDKAGPQVVFESVAPGDYTIDEVALPGYETSVACSNGNSSADGSLFVTLDPDEEVTCTFSNVADPGSIIVVKQTVAIDPPWSFAFTGDLGAFNLSHTQSSRTFNGVEAGDYTITETVPPDGGASVSCDSGAAGSAGVTVVLDPGEGVTCTFTNTTNPGSITVIKQTVGISTPWSFAFNGGLGPFSLTNANSSRTFSNLAAGDFAINETVPSGVTASVSCDSGESGTIAVTVALDHGEDVTCTFINTGSAVGYRALLPYIKR